MKKNLWMLTISAVIAGALIFTARFAVAQDLTDPAISSTQSQREGIEHNELDKDPPSLIQNWILIGIGFVLMVAPFIWWHMKRGQHEKEDWISFQPACSFGRVRKQDLSVSKR